MIIIPYIRYLIVIIKYWEKIYEKIRIFLIVLAIILTGCSSDNDTNKESIENKNTTEITTKGLYKGMNAEETYNTLIDYMNDKVTYFAVNILYTNEDADIKSTGVGKYSIVDGKYYLFLKNKQ